MNSRGVDSRGGKAGAALRHFLTLLRLHPSEFLDRLRNKVEFVREPKSVVLTHEEVLARAFDRHGYRASSDPLRDVHLLLGIEGRCPAEGDFAAEVAALQADARSRHGLDADTTLAHVLFCVALHLDAERVVETGVARGVSSRFLLRALEQHGHGGLWSIDLPPRGDDFGDQSGALVPSELRQRWTFRRGSSRRILPGLLGELGTIDLFIHDSQHTERNMTFELELGWRHLRPGGFIVADDIHENAAFRRFVERTRAPHVIGQEHVKAGLFGVTVKPAPEHGGDAAA